MRQVISSIEEAKMLPTRTIDIGADEGLTQSVQRILRAVKAKGDDAIKGLTTEFDGIQLDSFVVPVETLKNARESISKELEAAILKSEKNIRYFHMLQKPNETIQWSQPGKELIQRMDPLESAGVYVPGGMAAYPSSVLMNVIPAQVAGVKKIAVFTPPTLNTLQMAAVYATCYQLGITDVYAIGGAQAIAAAAFGTDTIQPVDIITGPGNQYVTEAKRQLTGKVKIDMLAGPSELMVVLDTNANLEFVASDLLAQAEHDCQAKCFLVLIASELEGTVYLEDLDKVIDKALENSIKEPLNPSTSEAANSNARVSIKNKQVFMAPTIEIAAAIANRMAPEHLSLQFEGASSVTSLFKNAGSIFVGPFTPEAVGDYSAGGNHVLPTSGTARFDSGLNVLTFMKQTQIIEYTQAGLSMDSDACETLATAERLPFHKKSLVIRRSGDEITG